MGGGGRGDDAMLEEPMVDGSDPSAERPEPAVAPADEVTPTRGLSSAPSAGWLRAAWRLKKPFLGWLAASRERLRILGLLVDAAEFVRRVAALAAAASEREEAAAAAASAAGSEKKAKAKGRRRDEAADVKSGGERDENVRPQKGRVAAATRPKAKNKVGRHEEFLYNGAGTKRRGEVVWGREGVGRCSTVEGGMQTRARARESERASQDETR